MGSVCDLRPDFVVIGFTAIVLGLLALSGAVLILHDAGIFEKPTLEKLKRAAMWVWDNV